MNYTISLEKYSGSETRHTCPKCGKPKEFTYYVDSNGRPFGSDIGRCNRIEKCGYDQRPYFHKNAEMENRQSIISFMRKTEMIGTFNNQRAGSTFAQGLLARYPLKIVKTILQKYHVGNLNGDVVFWQIDGQGRIRGGKVMSYKGLKRNGYTNWMHKVLKKENYQLEQCLFGLHLVNRCSKDSVISIVESEKTAVIASIYFPDAHFMATGGAQALNRKKLKPLAGHKIEIYPDIGQETNWEMKIQGFPNAEVVAWPKLVEWIPNTLKKGDDLADLFLKFTPQEWNKTIQ